MAEVPRAFYIFDNQTSPARNERSVYDSCIRSSMIYGNETRPLLAD